MFNITIDITNPHDKPYGDLSNNADTKFKLDDKSWNNVSSYVYTNLLSNVFNMNDVSCVTDYKDIIPTYNRLKQEETEHEYMGILLEGFKSYFENSEYSDLLLSTDPSSLLYASSDIILGTGNKNQGSNIYGKSLMQYRHMLKVHRNRINEEIMKNERENLVYDVYITYNYLLDKMKNNKDIKNYINVSVDKIIDKEGRTRLSKNRPDKEVILKLENKGKLDPNIITSIKYPSQIASIIRKYELPKMKNRMLREKKEFIFDIYSDFKIRQSKPELPYSKYELIKNKRRKSTNPVTYMELIDKVYDLYLAKKLPNMIDINERLKELREPPSEYDIIEAVNFELNKEDENKQVYVPRRNVPIIVYPNIKNIPDEYEQFINLSPFVIHPKLLKINNKLYPSIIHYLYTMLIHKQMKVSLNDAYNYILRKKDRNIDNIDDFIYPLDVKKIYEELLLEHTMKQKRELLTKSLNIKFSTNNLQSLLLATGGNDIIYKEYIRDDEFELDSITSEILVDIRSKVNDNVKDMKLDKFTPEQVIMLLEVDPFMRSWLKMRVNDICKVIRLVYIYMIKKGSNVSELSAKLTELIIDTIYQPCSFIFENISKLSDDNTPPEYFSNLVKLNNSLVDLDINDDVINVIWQRISVIFYFLLKLVKTENIINLRSVLGSIELLVSSKVSCVNYVNDNYVDCIISAVINLLGRINKFNKDLMNNIVFDTTEFELIVSIILSFSVDEKIKSDTDDINTICPTSPQYEEGEPEFFPTSPQYEEGEFQFFPTSPQYEEGDIIDTPYNNDVILDTEKLMSNILTELSKINIDDFKINDIIETKIIPEIKDINFKENINISDTFIRTINTIRDEPIPLEIKKNRIHFFASV